MAETKPQTLFAMNRSNLLILDCPIIFQIETYYDLEPESAWDDLCILWTVDDDGAIYNQTIQLTNESLVERSKKTIKVRFENVIPDFRYSCIIKQADEKSIALFQNLFITDAMSADSQGGSNG